MRDNKILILGSTGFLGRYFYREFGKLALPHTSGSALNLKAKEGFLISDLNSREHIKKMLYENEFAGVINCIALSDIDECERNPQKASWLNADLPKALAEECKSAGAKLIHISTDAVFLGDEPFSSETRQANPKSIYGQTKYRGECYVLDTNPDSLVFRVNFVGWNPRGKSLFNFFYTNLKNRKPVKGFHDIFFTPMYARDTVKIIAELMTKKVNGLFHVVGDERISKFEFGQRIARIMKEDPNLVQMSSYLDTNIATTRTPDLSLSNARIKELGILIPTISSGIEALVKEAEAYYG